MKKQNKMESNNSVRWVCEKLGEMSQIKPAIHINRRYLLKLLDLENAGLFKTYFVHEQSTEVFSAAEGGKDSSSGTALTVGIKNICEKILNRTMLVQ